MKKNILWLIAIAVSVSGCIVGPDYLRPTVNTPTAFKEAKGWQLAVPNDAVSRGKWWESYGDTTLNGLVEQIESGNQNVAAAWAQYRQASALVDAARAMYFPVLDGTASGSRTRGASGNANTTSNTRGTSVTQSVKLGMSASWEIDLWGKISRQVEADTATASASYANWQSVLLSTQALLVQTYIQLRAADVEKDLLARTVAAYERSLTITKNRYQAGVVSRLDVAQAQTQLQSTRAQLLGLNTQRAQYEHAIAVLLGKPPAALAITPVAQLPVLPMLASTAPAALLERRPDIANAERQVMAANAAVGVAQAAFFPSLSLNLAGGYQNNSISNLIAAPNRYWSLGSDFAVTLLDFGARSSQKKSAEAAYDKTVAEYRQTVLNAFQEVEDNLAASYWLAQQADAQQAATQAAEQAVALAENQYRAGTVGYLNVVTAQVAALTAQRNSVDVAEKRLLAHVALLKAFGGDVNITTVRATENVRTTAALPNRE
jgi:NodT family efflux transporter outer membrane factor (OMF) lipoprotein